jgi:hypothetical protein
VAAGIRECQRKGTAENAMQKEMVNRRDQELKRNQAPKEDVEP